jgi:hypothetical protein
LQARLSHNTAKKPGRDHLVPPKHSAHICKFTQLTLQTHHQYSSLSPDTANLQSFAAIWPEISQLTAPQR